MTDKTDFFSKCIELIRSDDPMTFEDGYHLLLPKVKEYGEELVELIRSENDSKTKSKLIELLGTCDDAKYIPIFKELLKSEAHDVVAWSLSSLDNLSSGDGKKIADDFRRRNPKWLE